VSFDIYVFDGDLPDDEQAIGDLLEDSARWGSSLTPRLAAFVEELQRRYPGIDEDSDDSPWASWPLSQAMVDGRCCGLNIVWSQAERMSAELRSLCGQHGLTLYDPQCSVVLRPDDSQSRSAPTKRPWWKRD
jgi:hypothetical protein